jgi:hypothetical protein
LGSNSIPLPARAAKYSGKTDALSRAASDAEREALARLEEALHERLRGIDGAPHSGPQRIVNPRDVTRLVRESEIESAAPGVPRAVAAT